MTDTEKLRTPISRAYKVKSNKEKLMKDLDNIEVRKLVDELISEGKLLPNNLYYVYTLFTNVENVFDKIIEVIEKEDKCNKTDTYSILLKFLYSNTKNYIANYLESTPDNEPNILDCFTLAKNIRLNNILLPKILMTISRNWNVVIESLGLQINNDKYYTKEHAFKMWFNSEGYKEGKLLKLLETLYSHLDVCTVDWKLLKDYLEISPAR